MFAETTAMTGAAAGARPGLGRAPPLSVPQDIEDARGNSLGRGIGMTHNCRRRTDRNTSAAGGAGLEDIRYPIIQCVDDVDVENIHNYRSLIERFTIRRTGRREHSKGSARPASARVSPAGAVAPIGVTCMSFI